MKILHEFFSSLVKEPNHLVASFWSLVENFYNERPRTNDQIVVDLTGFEPVISSLQMKRISQLCYRPGQNCQIHKNFTGKPSFMKIPFYEDNKSISIVVATSTA